MKKFSFSLDKVLKLREFDEKQAKIELGIAISEKTRIENELKLVAEQRVKNNQARENSSDIILLQSIENFINALDHKKDNLLEELANAQLIVEQKQQIMAEAMKQRKIISKLEEKQQLDYKIDKKRNIAKTLDELKNTTNTQ